MELPTCILVDPTIVECHDIQIHEAGPLICLRMEAIQLAAICPRCSVASARVHSRYHCHLPDLPWANVPVTLEVEVRRFWCDNPACPRRIFRERLATVAQAWARRTQRLAAVQTKIGLVSGGSAGAELCQALGCPAQVDALLHLIQTLALPTVPTPRVLGVDDWAKRKGQSYGTILIDHERGWVVELLPDRAPETLAQWLRKHPGVEIVTRDRAEAYAKGIRYGAPQARQVADRWHLLKNLTKTITKIFQDHQRAIQQQLRQSAPSPQPTSAGQATDSAALAVATPEIQAENVVPTTPSGAHDQPDPVTPAAQRRQCQAAEAHVLRQRGWHIKAIARHLSCHPKTIRRYLQRQLPLAASAATRVSKLDSFKS